MQILETPLKEFPAILEILFYSWFTMEISRSF